MDTRTKRPVRTAVSLGLGVALVATAGVVAATPIVSALATQSAAVTPAAARPAPAALRATVVRTALPSALTPQGHLHGVSCADAGCTLTAMVGTVDVKAAAGTKTLQVWKFADSTSAAPATAGAASALLEGTVGVPMTITIHNTLAVPVGLSIPQLDSEDASGQLQMHDVTIGSAGEAVVGAAAPGGDKTYTFTPNRAGTFTYQAALTDEGSRGVAMGLVGALVVRPSADPAKASAKVGGPAVDAVAYDKQEDPAAYADEAVLVYTDVDSAMTASPITFNMRDYRADYHLINGQAYPDVPSISSAPGHVVMVRVVNGAILEKSPTILGTRFNEFATGSRPLPTPLSVSGRLVQTGDTFDALVTMPDPNQVRYAIYDAPGDLRNGDEVSTSASAAKNAPALGGGMVLIDSGFVDGPLTGAVVTKLAAAGQPGSATSPITVSADLTSRDGGAVTSAELYVDSLAATPVPISVTGCTSSCSVSVTLDGTVLGGLTSGKHPMWVRAQTSNSAWGPYALIRIGVDNDGPAVTQLTLSTTTTNKTVDLDVTTTLDERTTGGSMVVAGRYWISTTSGDLAPGSTTIQGALTVNGPRLIASGDVTIPALVPDPADPTPLTPTLPLVPSDFGKLADGTYQLYVQGQDDRGLPGLGNWGKPVSTPLVIDTIAPVTTAITIDPTVTNGLVGSATKPGMVRITADVSDATSGVTAVDGYLDSVRPAGNANGIYFSKVSGTTWTADMPLSWLAGKKADGPVTLYVVGTDAAGNRSDGAGANKSATIVLDRTAPDVAITTASLVPSGNRFAVNVAATVSDITSGVAFAEYFVGADPGRNRGAALTLDQTLPYVGTANGTATSGTVSAVDVNWTSPFAGTVPVTVRSRDVAGNWSQATVAVPITFMQVFGNGFDTPTRVAAALSSANTPWNTRPTGRTTIVTAGRIAGQRSLSAAVGVVGYYTENTVKLTGRASSDLHALFMMAPGSSATGCATAGGAGRCAPKGVTVFAGTTARGAAAVTVQYGRASATSRVQFRLGVLRSTGATTWGAWTTVKAAKTYDVRVDWASGANGAAILHVNSPKTLSKVSVANASVRVTAIHVGVVNRVVKARGAILFDSVSIA